MQKVFQSTTVVIASILFGLMGCIESGGGNKPRADAIAVLVPTAGNQTQGVVTFTQVKDGVRVTAEINHLTPGLHGFHIHQFGDCRAADGTSAGGHFNPGKEPHGAPDADKRHMGDLGNLEADPSGIAIADFVDSRLTVQGPESIVGRGVIVHALTDDFKSQPTGAAGGRLACGVIGLAAK